MLSSALREKLCGLCVLLVRFCDRKNLRTGQNRRRNSGTRRVKNATPYFVRRASLGNRVDLACERYIDIGDAAAVVGC